MKLKDMSRLLLGFALTSLIMACNQAATEPQTAQPAHLAPSNQPEPTISPVTLTLAPPADDRVRSIVTRLLEIKANSTVRRQFIHPITDNGFGIISFNNPPDPTATATPSPQIEILANQTGWQIERSQQLGMQGMLGSLPVQVSFADGTSKLYTIELFLADEPDELGWRGMCPEITNDLEIWVP